MSTHLAFVTIICILVLYKNRHFRNAMKYEKPWMEFDICVDIKTFEFWLLFWKGLCHFAFASENGHWLIQIQIQIKRKYFYKFRNPQIIYQLNHTNFGLVVVIVLEWTHLCTLHTLIYYFFFIYILVNQFEIWFGIPARIENKKKLPAKNQIVNYHNNARA